MTAPGSDELRALKQRLREDVRDLQARGIAIAGWGIDEERGRLVVTLAERDPEAEAFLVHTYGALLEFEEGGPYLLK